MTGRDARPLGLPATGRAAQTAAVVSGHQAQYSTAAEPVALEIFKRSRWCVVAKVTFLDGEQILAIAHRNQCGVKDTISVPLVALGYAEAAGCRWLYFRRDRTAQMWRLPLADLRRAGWMATSDGVAELFVKIDRMEPTAWRKWEYTEQVIRLGEPAKPGDRQLDLFSGVGT